MRVINLTQGYRTYVDDEDYEGLSKYKWRACRDGNHVYAIAHGKSESGADTTIRMHREILKLTDSNIHCDHINTDSLDNRRGNLRICNKSENGSNRGKQKNNTSGYKGVSWDKSKGKYVSRIQKDGIEIFLGSFDCPKEAHEMYKAACPYVHGEFARTE